MEKKFLQFACDFKAADPKTGVAEMIVSVFSNTDKGGDIIAPGAFKESLAKKLPKGVWMHDWLTPVAKTLEARELEPGDPLLPESLKELGGLYVKGAFNMNVQAGKDAYEHLKFGSVDEFSIGFRTVASEYNQDDEIRTLKEVELFEWSPVLWGMNPATRLLSIKTDLGSDGRPLAECSTDQQAEIAHGAVKALLERVDEIREKRSQQPGQKVGKATLEHLETLRGELDDLLSKCLALDPKRETVADLRFALMRAKYQTPKEA